MLRVLILFATQLLLWTILVVTNHQLAAWQLTIHAGGLFVVFAGLSMGPREGLWAALLSGLLLDAGSPNPFGQQALLHGILFTLLLQYRPRLAHRETSVQVFVTLVINLLLYLLQYVLNYGVIADVGIQWERFFWDLAVSELVVGLCCPWLLSLQAKAVALATPAGFDRPNQEE